MNDHTVKGLPEPAADLSTAEQKKNWTKPALERFDIGSATQNGGNLPAWDGDHAPAQS